MGTILPAGTVGVEYDYVIRVRLETIDKVIFHRDNNVTSESSSALLDESSDVTTTPDFDIEQFKVDPESDTMMCAMSAIWQLLEKVHNVEAVRVGEPTRSVIFKANASQLLSMGADMGEWCRIREFGTGEYSIEFCENDREAVREHLISKWEATARGTYGGTPSDIDNNIHLTVCDWMIEAFGVTIITVKLVGACVHIQFKLNCMSPSIAVLMKTIPAQFVYHEGAYLVEYDAGDDATIIKAIKKYLNK